MRVTDISILANEVEVLSCSLRKQSASSRYIIKSIQGLDAEDLVPKFSGSGLVSGKKFHDFGILPRTLVMNMVLNPRFILHETYSSIRDEIYRAVSSTRNGMVEVQFHDAGSTVAHLWGFITKIEVEHFEQQPEVTVTLRCDDGLLRGIAPVVLGAADIAAANPIIFTDTISTAPHGFRFEIEFTATEASFTIRDGVDDDWEFIVTPSGGFLSGDVLTFSSEPGGSELYYVRSAATTHLLDKVDVSSVWPIIFPGANYFEFDELGSFTWNSVSWDTAYWGV